MKTNFDLEKTSIHSKFNARVSPRMGRRAGALVKSQRDVDDHRKEVGGLDINRRKNRVYDVATILAGNIYMLIGGLGFIAAMTALLFLAKREDVPHWAVYLTALTGLLGGWATIAGMMLRNAPNLPYILDGSEIDKCSKILEDSDERHRPVSGPTHKQFSFLMLTAEAALLLAMLLPIVADGLSPNAHLALTIPLAIFLGFLEWKLIQRIAHSAAILRVREKHSRLQAQSQFPEAQAKAAAIRQLYGDAVGHKWSKPSARDYLPFLGWLLVVVAVVIGVCSARLFASDQGAIGVVAAAALGGVAAVFFAIAVTSEVVGAALISEIAVAKRVLARFPSRYAFETEMAAQDAAFDAQIAAYFRHMRQAYEQENNVTTPGVPQAATLDFSGPPASPTESMTGRASPRQATSPGTGYGTGYGTVYAIPHKGATT